MSTLTLHLEDRLARELARAAAAQRLPLPEWAKVQLAAAAGHPPEAAHCPRVLGLHAGEPYTLSPDFNAPLEDFKEYL
jgi:hypothetical protein